MKKSHLLIATALLGLLLVGLGLGGCAVDAASQAPAKKPQQVKKPAKVEEPFDKETFNRLNFERRLIYNPPPYKKLLHSGAGPLRTNGAKEALDRLTTRYPKELFTHLDGTLMVEEEDLAWLASSRYVQLAEKLRIIVLSDDLGPISKNRLSEFTTELNNIPLTVRNRIFYWHFNGDASASQLLAIANAINGISRLGLKGALFGDVELRASTPLFNLDTLSLSDPVFVHLETLKSCYVPSRLKNLGLLFYTSNGYEARHPAGAKNSSLRDFRGLLRHLAKSQGVSALVFLTSNLPKIVYGRKYHDHEYHHDISSLIDGLNPNEITFGGSGGEMSRRLEYWLTSKELFHYEGRIALTECQDENGAAGSRSFPRSSRLFANARSLDLRGCFPDRRFERGLSDAHYKNILDDYATSDEDEEIAYWDWHCEVAERLTTRNDMYALAGNRNLESCAGFDEYAIAPFLNKRVKRIRVRSLGTRDDGPLEVDPVFLQEGGRDLEELTLDGHVWYRLKDFKRKGKQSAWAIEPREVITKSLKNAIRSGALKRIRLTAKILLDSDRRTKEREAKNWFETLDLAFQGSKRKGFIKLELSEYGHDRYWGELKKFPALCAAVETLRIRNGRPASILADLEAVFPNVQHIEFDSVPGWDLLGWNKKARPLAGKIKTVSFVFTEKEGGGKSEAYKDGVENGRALYPAIKWGILIDQKER